MGIRGRTATEKNKVFVACVHDGMRRAGRNPYPVSRPHYAKLVSDLHTSCTTQDVVNLFCHRMVMRFRRRTRFKCRFGKGLITNRFRGVPGGEYLTDGTSIFGGKRRNCIAVKSN